MALLVLNTIGMFTLDDLDKEVEDGVMYYRFPVSPMRYRESDALYILRICNFTGKLTDNIQPIVMVKVIDLLEKLESKLTALEANKITMSKNLVRLQDWITPSQFKWLTRVAKKAGVSRSAKLREILTNAAIDKNGV